MALIGRVEEFKESWEDSASYLERFELRLVAKEIAVEKKVSIFLAVIGPEAYGFATKASGHDLCTVNCGTAVSLPAEALGNYGQNHFQKHNQKGRQSVAGYTVALRQVSTRCDFGAHLSEALRDRLLNGLASEARQRKLLMEKDLTFTQACEIAQSVETVLKKQIPTLPHKRVKRSTEVLLWRTHSIAWVCLGSSTKW